MRRFDLSTGALENVFQHLECVDCADEARLFRSLAEERDSLLTKWQSIETVPVDEWVILATTGDWVGQAIYGEDGETPMWRWAGSKEPIHPDLTPLGWQPMPAPISEPAR